MLPKAAILLALAVAPFGLAQDPYPITGVSIDQGANGVPLRHNINDLQAAGGPQWDLYIRSLLEMQQENYENWLSYFQIAGIHGSPFIEWNGTGSRQGNGWGGYCPHGEDLFLTWHRPYVLLFEVSLGCPRPDGITLTFLQQVLVSHATRLAQTYPQSVRRQYVQAARQLRSPYWDWAASPTVPQATAPEKVQVNFPNGQNLQRRQVDNPLYTFRIPQPVLNGRYGPFDSRPRTIRCPAPDNYPGSANGLLSQRPYKQWVYDAFTRSTSFSEFSTSSDNAVSLEIIHNGIHWDAACGQQFVTAQYSAFDPLFNVDRLWAYWQAIRPDQDIFSNSYSGQSRFATPEGTTITPRSPLPPFVSRGRTSHTSESVRSIRGFGYSYQGLEYWEKSADQMKQNITSLINRLYGPDQVPERTKRQEPQEKKRYFARVSLDRAKLPKPCQVNVYVHGKQASSFVVMSEPAAGIIKVGLPLDDAMQGNSMQVMSSDAAASSIESSLAVKIVKADGGSMTQVPGMDVKLEDVMVTPSQGENEFPTYRASKVRPVKAKPASD